MKTAVVCFVNNRLSFTKNPKKNNNSKPISREFVMLTAISASGIGRVIGLDTGKDIALGWAKKKATKLGKNTEEQTLITEKLLKKIKFPVTFASTLFGVLAGLFVILIPAKLYNDRVKKKGEIGDENSSKH
jgi:hypothetical protein